MQKETERLVKQLSKLQVQQATVIERLQALGSTSVDTRSTTLENIENEDTIANDEDNSTVYCHDRYNKRISINDRVYLIPNRSLKGRATTLKLNLFTKMDTSLKVEDSEKNATIIKRKVNNPRPYRKNKNDTSIIETPEFVGMCAALSEYVHDCSSTGQAEQYSKTTEKIAEYVGTEYTMGSNIRTAIETLTTSTLTMPIEPGANASRTETFMWQENVKIYMRKIDQLF